MSTPKRPGRGCNVATPIDEAMIQLLGPGAVSEDGVVTKDQFRAIQRLYGYHAELPNKRPDPPAPLPPNATWDQERKHKAAVDDHARWTDPRAYMQAGADR